MTCVYIGLGSNLDCPEKQLKIALMAINELNGVDVICDSGLFKSKAMTLNDEQQPDYFNAVVKIECQMSPHQLLDALQTIENNQGRVREHKWGSRTLDLDILLYDDLQLNDERLTVPHPGIAERAFVLYPLQRLATDLNIPGLGRLSDMLKNVSAEDVQFVGALQ